MSLFNNKLQKVQMAMLADDVQQKFNSTDATLAQILQQNNNTVTYAYNPDGSIQSETEKDTNNNVVRTVTYTYTAGDLATSVTVMNGKTVTITYNYDASGNVTSTSNTLS